jgi:prepilin-type N-terminal cleavage/methylation domain-containing protein
MRKLVKAIRRLYRGGEKGFTLIELLVVVGILAALAGVVTLGVTQFIGRGANEANCTDLHNVQTAVSACMVDNAAADCDTVAKLQAFELLLTPPKCTYTIVGGVVTGQACTKGNTCVP